MVKSFHTELHVCGNLTVSGTGFLTPKNPSTDYLIIIENGSLTLSSTADISVVRTAIIFTGNNTKASAINFPNGTGHTATLGFLRPQTRTIPGRELRSIRILR